MEMPQIRLQSQTAKIELNRIPAQQSIEQPKAEMSIEQPKADVRIETRPSKLTIDQTQAWKDMGFMGPLAASEENAQSGRQAVLEGISRRASEGDQLMKIEHGGNPIPSIAYDNAHPPMKEFNIGWIPSHGSVKINYQPAEVQIKAQPNKPRISVNPQDPVHNYQPGRIDIALKQYANLEIDFVNVNWKETTI